MKKRLAKFARIFGFLLLAGITLFALWTAWENWTGAREWKETRLMLVAEGIELDARKLVPPLPPENRNFARTPLIAAVTDVENSPAGQAKRNPELAERFREMQLPDFGELKPLPSWKTATPANLDGIRKSIAEKTGSDGDILAWMEQFGPDLAEIDEAAQLPEAQIPFCLGDTFIELVSVPLPYLNDFMDFQKLQSIRACAALRAGDNQQARAALHTSFQLQRTSMSQPTLISFLVGKNILDQSLSVIWEGLNAGLWTEDDLRWIGNQLAALEVLPHLEESFVFEMVAFQFGAANFMKSISAGDARKYVTTIGALGGDPSGSFPFGWLVLLVPDGVWDHNLAYGARAMLEESIQPVRERRLPDPGLSRLKTDGRNLHNFLSHLSFPAFSSIASRSFETAVSVRLARIACAVELYHLKNGEFPPSADALVPDFLDKLPEDFFDPGNPLKYEKGAQGDRYRVYSVGKNWTDDAGEVAFEPKGNQSRRDLEKGDWAWGYRFPEREK